MNIKDKLNLMKQIEENNQKFVEEWKLKNMKIWVADYGFIDSDGARFEEWENDPVGKYRIQVEALDIQGALDEAKRKLLEKATEEGWKEVRIWNIGICNENIW